MEQIININTGAVTTVTPEVDSDELARRAAALLANKWAELRRERNQRLFETDYLALSDVTLSDEMKTYRQALRDLPANTSDPAAPTWPTKPGG